MVFKILLLCKALLRYYKCTDFYHPGDEGGIAWNDPQIGIDWPEITGVYKESANAKGYCLDNKPLIISDKDQKWPNLSVY